MDAGVTADDDIGVLFMLPLPPLLSLYIVSELLDDTGLVHVAVDTSDSFWSEVQLYIYMNVQCHIHGSLGKYM